MLKKLINTFTNKLYIKLLYIFVGLSFATIISDIPYFNFFNKAVLAYGLLLVGITLLEIIIFRRRPFFLFEIFLYLFLGLTLYLNYNFYNIRGNFNVWLVNLMIFTVLFSIDSYKDKKVLLKEINIISYFYVGFTFITSLGDFLLVFLKKSSISLPSFFMNYESVFKNENSLGVAAGISVLLSIYLIYQSRNNLNKTFNLINIILQFITLALSGGRSSYLLILSILFSYILFKLKKNYQRILLIILPLTVSIIAFFTLPGNILHKIFTSREYIWQSAIRLIAKYPLIGVGSVNKIGRLQDVRVTYLQGVEAGGLHNIFFEVAVVNGLIALCLFILFLISLFVFFFKNINTIKGYQKNSYLILFSLLIGLVFVNLLESSLLYIISFISIIFWIYAGYLVALTNDNR